MPLLNRDFSLLLILLVACINLSYEAEFCVIGDDDGDFNVFDLGEAVPVPNVCGFTACFCDPALDNQLLCSFCYDARRDECLINGETKVFMDDAICSCDSSSIDFECQDITSSNTDDMPTQKPPPQTPCVFRDETGANVILDTLDVEGPCSGKDFPYICNTERNLLLYPYCEHKTNTGATICARDGEYVIFVDEQGDNRRCDCTLNPETLQSIADCSPAVDRTVSPTPSPIGPTEPQSAATTTSYKSVHQQMIWAACALVVFALVSV